MLYLINGIKNVKVQLLNNSTHYISLRKNKELYHLDYVSSVITLEVKKVDILHTPHQ